VIGAAKRRPVEFTQATGEFRPLREQYPGFRLYARELEDVKSLRLDCAEQGIQVRTNEERIQGVLYLDSALGKFLAFIVVAGGMGGVGALFTSLYLSIERSRRQFAVLQILGIPRFHVFVSTLLQAILMVLAGGIASFVFFQIGSWLLTAVLAPENNAGGKVCELKMWQWGVLAGASVFCAFLATILALGRLRFEDPAVVARSE
jgi:putative ABC transport system permease protein